MYIFGPSSADHSSDCSAFPAHAIFLAEKLIQSTEVRLTSLDSLVVVVIAVGAAKLLTMISLPVYYARELGITSTWHVFRLIRR
jgi:hypothetical protein